MGVAVDVITKDEAIKEVMDATMAGRGHWTLTANLDHLRRYTSEPTARELIDAADVVVADGAPVVWASRLAGTPLPERVAGSDMIWSIGEAASRHDVSIFLLGGNPGAAENAAQVLWERNDGLEIAGTLCPPLGFENDQHELDDIQRRVREAAPQIVLVGLPFPKQELLIMRLRRSLPQASFVGVGVSFSFVTGEVPRAPGWTHGLGLEWLYRLLKEPRRLFRRYIFQGVPFAVALFALAARHRAGADNTGARWGWILDSAGDE